MKSWLRKLLWALCGVVVLGGLVFAGLGGREGVLLFYVRHFMRTDPAPAREVVWQAGPQTPVAGERKKPNIIVILTDDLGFNDISFYGGGIAGGKVPTPNINSIGHEGVQFRQGYAGNATCSPSRAAIMTGRYATRFGFEFTPVPVQFMKLVGGYRAPGSLRGPVYHAEREAGLPPYESQGLPKSEVSIARLLQGAGYRTLHLGKWHLGDSPQFRAYSHGFDESLSIQHGGSMYMAADDPGVINARQDFDPIDRFLWAAHPWGLRFNDSEVFKPKGYLTDQLTDEAIKAIAANKNRPFFMYLAYTAPHTPLQATVEDFKALEGIEDHTTRVYAAMIRSLDRNIGRLLSTLKTQGLDDNTLVVFTSDNGGAHYVGVDNLNKPYRGWKATYFEGGTHVPFFMRWPAGLPKGAIYDQPVSHFDIFATAAALAGAPVPKDRVIDGVDLVPFVRGEKGGVPHQQLFWRGGDYLAVRQGDWKLQVTQRPKQDWLFNLAQDPGERNNLAASMPDKVAELKKALAAFNAQQAKPLWASLAEAPIPLDKTLRQPQLADDAYVYFAN